MVEAELKGKLGPEKLQKVVSGLKDYIKRSYKKRKQTKEIFEAIEVLSSLGDFKEFKNVMLDEKKRRLNGGNTGGGLRIIDKGVLDVEEF